MFNQNSWLDNNYFFGEAVLLYYTLGREDDHFYVFEVLN